MREVSGVWKYSFTRTRLKDYLIKIKTQWPCLNLWTLQKRTYQYNSTVLILYDGFKTMAMALVAGGPSYFYADLVYVHSHLFYPLQI